MAYNFVTKSLQDFSRGINQSSSQSNIGDGYCEDLLNMALAAKVISIQRVGVEKVKQSQFVNLKFKKDDLPDRLHFMKLMGKKTPVFSPSLPPSNSIASALRNFYIYFNIKASSDLHFKSLLLNTPFPVIRLYYGIYKYLSKI